MNGYLKFAYNLGVQIAREKYAGGTSIAHQRKAPTWGLSGAPMPPGFEPVPPAPPQRTPSTTQGLPAKAPSGGAAAARSSAAVTTTPTARSTTIGPGTTARPITGGTMGPRQGTAAGVPEEQHAWNQQAGRLSAGDAQANIAANKDISSVVVRGNREMAQIIKDTGGDPGASPALTAAQVPGSNPNTQRTSR